VARVDLGTRTDRRHGSRIAQQKWIDKIIAVDLVDERLARAQPAASR
jgi:hypothetical protein